MSSKFDQVLARCEKQCGDQGIKVDSKLLTAIAKSLGPSIYKRDALLVAASDTKELDGIKKSFLVGKLGCKDDGSLDTIVHSAIDKIGKSNRQKLRPVFYYLLAKEAKKESVFKA